MSTPHIDADPGDFAPAVLMPGDPRRAQLIAEALFDEPRLVNDVRGILGYTGTIGGQPISVMASGMGCPSITIYATELYRFFGVRRIIRVGTAGAMQEALQLGDVIAASAAHTDSAMAQARIPGVSMSHAPSFNLLLAAVEAAATAEVKMQVGPIFSSDHFYVSRPETAAALIAHGTLAVEMESAALYAVAAAERAEALTLLTVTDHLGRGERMTPKQREDCFLDMSTVAIAAALSR
ncbi:purine-nucleoside phosphorylase [Nakamurella panacisegetis]|uniref:Uridine phosphorylase n=1 Tax=Nakamurella panacisegetis TaxID=1090615 RepID=A0A1H0PA64_9ACTN|nr:purine-nucleoside phosphorylase [Nakamurella panacisegetis]SDP01549.1 purine-nucleoside phosphorylase [Nakamurella panacisegetis]